MRGNGATDIGGLSYSDLFAFFVHGCLLTMCDFVYLGSFLAESMSQYMA